MRDNVPLYSMDKLLDDLILYGVGHPVIPSLYPLLLFRLVICTFQHHYITRSVTSEGNPLAAQETNCPEQQLQNMLCSLEIASDSRVLIGTFSKAASL